MQNLHSTGQKALRNHVEKIERLQTEIKALASDVKDELLVAKQAGFNPKIIRKLLALRKKPKAERDEEEAILAVYAHALGLDHTPLGDFADKQEVLEAAH